MEETWLDVMPAIPLAYGVPVLARDDGLTGVVTYLRQSGEIHYADGDEDGAGVVLKDDDTPVECPLSRLVVDLGDPQGFAYALRWVYQRGWPHRRYGEADNLAAAARRHTFGRTTDADRLAMARACAEVVR